MKAKNAGEFFGTLQQSIVAEWRKHLKTSKYSKHMALDEFYTEMPELDYQAINGVIDEYSCAFESSSLTALEYLEELREFIKDSRSEFIDGESELASDLDNILSLIDSTIYKVRELKENKIMSLKSYLNESLNDSSSNKKSMRINEAATDMDEAAYDGFQKIADVIDHNKFDAILYDKLNMDGWALWDDEDDWSKWDAEKILIHFVKWCLSAYDEFDGEDEADKANDWFVNIVDNMSEYLDGGIENLMDEYDLNLKDEKVIRAEAKFVITKVFPKVYKSIVKRTIKIH